ncbi:universal stress protein [Ancylomarina salipaludis]|uniref:Universal stress protein n=1 Tax=Ancylomarina salipaludis TaxID=2501299 RepID=A0A4Q1JHP5_9BACT|nr:universal stress protein [Ancylomarina salipaludis]RXQ87613.1 universal stress protein [Ancylomarina salipaludis]
MKERGKAIVVGWDFSEYSKLALDHALFYAYQTNLKVCLIHIVRRESDIGKIEAKLQREVDHIYHTRGKRVDMMVRVGSVSSGLKAAAIEISAEVVFIGTHGVRGIQNYVGSHVLKTITNSVIPFVIVQAPREKHRRFTLVCPIDSRKECKEVLYWVTYLARLFGANISLVYPEYKMPEKRLKTKANVNFSKNYLRGLRMIYDEVKLDAKGFNNAIINYAKEKQADLILTITNRQPKVQNYFFVDKIQYLLANKEKIPVLCISPRKDLWLYGNYK